MNFDDFKYRPELIPNDVPGREFYYEELTKEFNEILDNDPRVVDFFNQYDSASVKAFKDSYIKSLIEMIRDQKYILDREHETKETRYRAKAEKLFELIKQKKLFNMQILWRAEQLTIPGLNVCYHFEHWGAYHINECPFLDEITPKELHVLKDFLYEPNFSAETRDWLCGWQAYSKIMAEPEMEDDDEEDMEEEEGLKVEQVKEEKEEEEDEEDEDAKSLASAQRVFAMFNYPAGMPEWYQFYDSRMGTGGLLSLKDIRLEKELKYQRAGAKKELEERNKTLAANPPKPFVKPLEYLSIENGLFNMVFQKDEHLKFLGKIFYVLRMNAQEEREKLEKITEAIWLLNEADTPIFFSPDLEWKEAILLAASNYLNGKIEAELDLIYDEYLFFRNSGIAAPANEDEISKSAAGMVQSYEKRVLAGRKIFGEPEDFNY